LSRDCRDLDGHVDAGVVKLSAVVRHLASPLATIAMGAAALAVATLRWWSVFVALPALAVARLLDPGS
jgi:hypothetical protein